MVLGASDLVRGEMTTSNDRLVRKLVAGGVVGAGFGLGVAWVFHSRRESQALAIAEGTPPRAPQALRVDEVLRLGFALFGVVRQAIDLVNRA